jgi:ankyrin repeat protein
MNISVYKTTNSLGRILHSSEISLLSETSLSERYEIGTSTQIPIIPNEDVEPETGRTPLHYAVCAVDNLLCNGFDPLKNTKDSKRTAFHFAAARGNPKLVERLLRSVPDARAVFESRDQLERTPLHYVSQGPSNDESQQIVSILMKGNENLPLAKDKYQSTALLLSVVDENEAVVKKLLSFPVFREKAINLKDCDNRTPLSHAEYNTDLINLLQEHGAE